jgi:hypothetical protein
MIIKSENYRNFSEDRHLGMSHYMKSITVTKVGCFITFVAVQLLKILKQLALLSLPPYRFAHFAMSLLDRGKLKCNEVNVFFYNGALTKFY